MRNALPAGGVPSVYFLEGKPETTYPQPRHVFSADGIKRLPGLVGGFGEAAEISVALKKWKDVLRTVLGTLKRP